MGVLGQLCSPLCDPAVSRRAVPEYITEPFSESVAQISYHFVRQMTGAARVVPILHQRQLSVRIPEDMVPLEINWTIKFGRSCRSHRQSELGGKKEELVRCIRKEGGRT
jgi:hypothetical protein